MTGHSTTVHSTMPPPLPTPLRWASASKAPPRRAVSLDSGAATHDAEFVLAPSAARAPIVRLPPHALNKSKASGATLPTSAARNSGITTSEAPSTASAVDVFLAGSCNPTTWRRDTAMPMFEQAQIRYYNPQVDEWYEELILEETRAKEAATIILMVIDSATRSIVGINEAVECVCRGRRIILVVQDIQAGTVLEDATVTAKELVELNGAREYLRRLARQRGVRLYADVAVAVAETAASLVEEKSKRLAPKRSPPLRTRCSLSDWRGGSVYLGGNLQSTSWRDKGAIPLFKKAGIPVHDSHSAELQRLVASRDVNHLILFVVSGRSRSIAAMIEAVELICSHLATCLVIEPLEPGGELDDGERLEGRDFKDVARARAYLQEMAQRHNVQVFPSLLAAVDGIIKGPFCG
jgi:hypothetical protein